MPDDGWNVVGEAPEPDAPQPGQASSGGWHPGKPEQADAATTGGGWNTISEEPDAPPPAPPVGPGIPGMLKQAAPIASDVLHWTGPAAWTPPPGQQVAPSPELEQKLATASRIAGRPVSAWEIGENWPGEVPGEILPLSTDQQGGIHWAVPGFLRGAASVGTRAAGLQPWRFGEQPTSRELAGLTSLGGLTGAPGAVPVTGPLEGFRLLLPPPEPPPAAPLQLTGPRPGGPPGAPTAGGPGAPAAPPVGAAGGTEGWRITLRYPRTYDEAVDDSVRALVLARAKNQPAEVIHAIADALAQAKIAFGAQDAAAPPPSNLPNTGTSAAQPPPGAAAPPPSGAPAAPGVGAPGPGGTATMARPVTPSTPGVPPNPVVEAPPAPAAPQTGTPSGEQAAAGAAGAPPPRPLCPICRGRSLSSSPIRAPATRQRPSRTSSI